jgi:hypothetical protein
MSLKRVMKALDDFLMENEANIVSKDGSLELKVVSKSKDKQGKYKAESARLNIMIGLFHGTTVHPDEREYLSCMYDAMDPRVTKRKPVNKRGK